MDRQSLPRVLHTQSAPSCLSYKNNCHIICRRTNYEAPLYVTFISPISNVLCPNTVPTTLFLHVLKLYSSRLVRSHVFHQHKQVHVQQLCVMHSVVPQRRFEQLKQRVTKTKYLRCQGRAWCNTSSFVHLFICRRDKFRHVGDVFCYVNKPIYFLLVYLVLNWTACGQEEDEPSSL